MIHFRQTLTQQDAQWVLNEVFPVFNHRIALPTLTRIMEGHNKVFEEQVGVPGCGCEYKATHAIWCSRLEQYKPQIEAIANPTPTYIEQTQAGEPTWPEVKKTRGRKKNEDQE